MTASAFAITASGPGPLSLDRRVWGTPWALAALAAGVGGGYAATKYGERNAPAEAEGPAPEQAQEEAPAI
jgi:hypothetical protein